MENQEMYEFEYLSARSGQVSCRIYPEELQEINENFEEITGAKRKMTFREFLLAILKKARKSCELLSNCIFDIINTADNHRRIFQTQL